MAKYQLDTALLDQDIKLIISFLESLVGTHRPLVQQQQLVQQQ